MSSPARKERAAKSSPKKSKKESPKPTPAKETPRSEPEAVDFQQSARNLTQVAQVRENIQSHVIAREDASEVCKHCNFTYIPGVLFNRKLEKRT